MSTDDKTRTGSQAKTVVVTGDVAVHRSKAELRADAMTARAELARTLDAIEYTKMPPTTGASARWAICKPVGTASEK